jgi:hypothetical protein
LVNGDGRLSRAGIVAALGHVVAIYLAARIGPGAVDLPNAFEPTPGADLVAVEMWLDAEPATMPEPPAQSLEPRASEAATPAPPAGASRGATRGRASKGGAEAGTAGPTGTPESGDGFSPLDKGPWDPRLRLSDVVDLAPAPPAPTRPPPRRVVTADDTNEAVRSLVRDQDKQLGLGNPQETIIAAAVQEAGRASGVPSGTRFVVSVVLDGDGNVTDATIRGDTAGDSAWSGTLAAIRGKLSKPVPLGIDERGRGARVTVDATLLHVYPSGSDKAVVIGECPKIPLVGGEAPAPYFWMGGAGYGDLANGTCALSDGDAKDSLKTIVVRTTTKTHHAGQAPPALSSAPPKPRPRRLPTPMELIINAINAK